jgi:hypothetical protein
VEEPLSAEAAKPKAILPLSSMYILLKIGPIKIPNIRIT